MNVRVAIRNWLLKPSKAELAGDPKAVALASERVFGHVLREMKLEVDAGEPGLREIPSLPDGWGAGVEAQRQIVDFGEMTKAESAFVNGGLNP